MKFRYRSQVPSQSSDTTSDVFHVLDNKTASVRRRLFQAAGTKRITLEWEPQVIDLTDAAVQNIKCDSKNYGSSDVMKQWALMTSDIAGRPFGNVKNDEKSRMIQDIDLILPIVGIRAELPWTKPFFGVIPAILPFSLNRLWDRYNMYGEEAVKATRAAQAGGAKTMFAKMVLDEESA